MLAVAREKTNDARVEYMCAAMEDAQFPDESFDMVLSSLALHYIGDFTPVVKRVHGWLKPGGSFVFSCEHPVSH